MAPKKKMINGFLVFTKEWKNKHGRAMGMAEATTNAGRIWEKMTQQERQPYNERAKKEKISYRNIEKLTCTGKPISEIENERMSHEDAERKMKRSIETMVRNSVRRDELSEQSYYFLMVNYFVKAQNSVYIPAEIAVSEYSLKNGVVRKYHTFINPDVSVYGHQYEAQQHAETTHKLPLPPKAKGETNLLRIYNDVLKFIQNEDGGDDYPPVFTDRDSIIPVKSVLDFLKDDSHSNPVTLEVYSIQYLFYILKEAACQAGEIEPPKSFYITDAYFECDNFEYETGIACQFHEDCDRTKYCPLSRVTRWGFMFSDYMCSDIAIPLIPGRHVPQRTNLSAVIYPGESSTSTPKQMSNSKSAVSIKSEKYATAVSDSQFYDDDQHSSTSNSTHRSPGERHERRDRYHQHPRDSRYNANEERTRIRNLDDRFESFDRSVQNPWARRSFRHESTRMPDDSHFSINPYEDEHSYISNARRGSHRDVDNDDDNMSTYRNRYRDQSMRDETISYASRMRYGP